MRTRAVKYCLVSLAVILIMLAALIYHACTTEAGIRLLARAALNRYLFPERISIGKVEGTLFGKVSLEDITLEGVRYGAFSFDASFQGATFSLFPLDDSVLTVMNGKVTARGFEPFLLYGTYKAGDIDFNLYTKRINLGKVFSAYRGTEKPVPIEGLVDEVDLYFRGPLSKPAVTGSLLLSEVAYRALFVNQCPLRFDLTMLPAEGFPRLFGDVFMGNAVVSARGAFFMVPKGRITFNGDISRPYFDVAGISSVEDTRIFLTFKGTMDNPYLSLTSVPPLSRETLVVMLATGKTWKTQGIPLIDANVSDPVKRIVDYFVFGKGKGALADMLGMNEIALRYDDSSREIRFKKILSDQANLNYSIAQEHENEGGAPQPSQRMGLEYRLGEFLSLETETDVNTQESLLDDSQNQSQDKLLLKFKKEF